jgi:hypothetical protein
MLDALKPLLDNSVLTEDTRTAITEAWSAKLNEAREEIRTEMREEFANRYSHDKKTMIAAVDKMVTESLQAEIAEFAKDKKSIVEQRVVAMRKLAEQYKKFDKFLVAKLAEEISEFRNDRKKMNESSNKLEKFVIESLAKEIGEFYQDKKAVVETRTKLVKNATKVLNNLKESFIRRSAAAVKETVSKNLTKEITQLREDINSAKSNNFGRKIFEAFASEFSNSQLNESAELRKLYAVIQSKDKKLAESVKIVTKHQALLESQEAKIRNLAAKNQRDTVLSELLAPLNRENQKTMRGLLEGVNTDQLKTVYEKYLPSVLNETAITKKSVINESKSSVTGNKTAKDNITNELVDVKRLAGLN